MRRFSMLVTCAGAMFIAPLASAQSLATARDLYASAAYEDALTALNAVDLTRVSADDARLAEQYRAFALLALGRQQEAERAIETIVTTSPLYEPPASDTSPRVRAAFTEVRRRVFPTIVQQRYVEARGAFDRQAYAEASRAFDALVTLLDHPSASAGEEYPLLGEYRTLAAGYQDLSARLAPKPSPAVEMMAVTRLTPVYDSTSSGVMPPGVVQQSLPPFPAFMSAAAGVLEVVINEAGLVESAAMRASVHPTYDSIALDAARGWVYKPATRDGVPVKYRKFVQIAIKR